MEFFESALKLVKSDEAIFAIVVVVAFIFLLTILKKRAKNSESGSFNKNENNEVEVDSKSDATIKESGNENKDLTIIGGKKELHELDDEEILILKQLSVLPSIEIEFEFLKEILNRKEDEAFEEILNYLTEKGWISSFENSYKLHQITKDYIFSTHLPKFKEIESILDYYLTLMYNARNPQVAVDNRDKLHFFDAFVDSLIRVATENEKVANYFNYLGLIYSYLGEFNKAEPLHKKALEIREKVLGEEHSDIAISYNNLALLYFSKGEYDKAEPLYKKSLEIGKKVLGEWHPNTGAGYNNLASLYDSKGEYDKAEPLFKKALEIYKKILGEWHPETGAVYNHLAKLYYLKGEYDKAELLYKQVLEIYKKVLGEWHPETASSYHNLGAFYYNQGWVKKGYEFMKRAVEVGSKVLPANHSDLIDSKKWLESMEKRLQEGAF